MNLITKPSACLLIFFLLLPVAMARAEARQQSWSSDQDMVLFWEAAGLIRDKSIHKVDMRQVVQGSLRAYLAELDPYAQFLEPEQYRAYQENQNARYSGVGMELDRDDQGRYTCLPYPEGPADQAGIQAGDRLVRVNGKRVKSMSLWQVVQKVRGKAGSRVVLTVRRGSGKTRNLRVTRALMPNRTVLVDRVDGIPLVRILRFGNLTPSQLREALLPLKDADPLILDLRGNPGGDLDAAIDSAAMLVPKGKLLVTKQTRSGSKSFTNTSTPLHSKGKVYVWQDERTASAAEMFCAALAQNQAAVSIGRTTYGKGLAQSILELSNGSALILTDTRLIPPDGQAYHGRGIAPQRELKGKNLKDRDYLAVSKPPQKAAPPPAAKSKKSAAPQPAAAAPPDVRVRILEELPRDQKELLYIACFNRKYNDPEKGRQYARKVLNSVDVPGVYLMRMPKEAGYLVCCGHYSTKGEADGAGRQLESLMKGPSVITLGVTPETLIGRQGKNKQSFEWGIKVGFYGERDNALKELKHLKDVGLAAWVSLLGYRSREQAQPGIKYFRDQGFLASWDSPCAQTESDCAVRYQVYAGPYESRDDVLLGDLKKAGKVGQDALWQEVPPPAQ